MLRIWASGLPSPHDLWSAKKTDETWPFIVLLVSSMLTMYDVILVLSKNIY